jgi:hypothetical protein
MGAGVITIPSLLLGCDVIFIVMPNVEQWLMMMIHNPRSSLIRDIRM